MGKDSEREPSFKVQDRRRFDATGEARSDVDEKTDEPARADSAPHSGTPPRDAAGGTAEHAHSHSHGDHAHDHAHEHDHAHGDHDGHEHHEHGHAHEITFASFVFSLSTQALIHLGEVPDPVDGSTHVNLDAARQIIDIVALLRDKTRGNLDAAENSLLESALYDLRMRYVERARKA